jgi:hypothetical protein
MPKVSKIDQFGLGDEVIEMRNSGMSLEEIAQTLKHRHKDITSLKDINPMTVHRHIKRYQVNQYKNELLEGEDPETQLREQLRVTIDDWEDETHEIYLIMKKALKRIIKEGNDWKTIKASKDLLVAIDQSRKNLVTQVEEGFRRFGDIDKAKKVNFVQINNMLIGVSELLCEQCRRKLVNYIDKMEEESYAR